MAAGILHRTILTRIVSLSSNQLHQHRSIQSVAGFSLIRRFNYRREGSHVCTSRQLHGSSALSAKKGDLFVRLFEEDIFSSVGFVYKFCLIRNGLTSQGWMDGHFKVRATLNCVVLST